MIISTLFCGDIVLKPLLNFGANQAPIILSFTSDQTPDSKLSPGQSFNISVTAEDPDYDELTFTYLADIGTFSNQINETNNSTVIYTLPSIIPAGFIAKIAVLVSDPKKAKSSKILDLGSGRVGLGISLNVISSLYIQPQQDIDLAWQADGNGFFQVKLVAKSEECLMNENAGFTPFSANTPAAIKVCGNTSSTNSANCFDRFSSTDAQKKLCIMVRDTLQQDAFLTTILTSDNTDPIANINPSIEGGKYPVPKTVTISCTDNFLCKNISYVVLKGGNPPDPDFSANGTILETETLDLLVGDQGDGVYTLKYIIQDAALNESNGGTVFSTTFTIDSQAPLITANVPQYSYVSSNGFTSSSLQWQSDKLGTYQLKVGNSCATGANLTIGSNLSGTYSTIGATVDSVINASELTNGVVNNIRICFTTQTFIEGEDSRPITRDDTQPTVISVIPAENAVNVLLNSSISFTFNKSLVASTVTTNTDLSCSGSLQVSNDNFTTCVPMQAAPVSSFSDTVFTISPTVFSPLTSYLLRVNTTAKDIAGNSLASDYTTTNAFITMTDTGPAVSSVTSSTNDGTYDIGATISIQITFSTNVLVTGTPVLALNTGVNASYSSGSGSNTLTFSYTISGGEYNTDLNYSSNSSLTLPGSATIKDSFGLDGLLTLPPLSSINSLAGSKAIVVDTRPKITNITSSTTDGTYGIGSPVSIEVTFGINVVVSGFPALALNSGGIAIYSSGTGSNTLTFLYTIIAGEYNIDLDHSSTSSLTLPGGATIKASFGLDAILTLPLPGAVNSIAGSKAIVVDTRPVVSFITSSTANNTYGTGVIISIQIVFSANVTITGIPELALNSGGTATYSTGSGTISLNYSYVIGVGQNAGNLEYSSTSALTLAGGSTIGDGFGLNAVLTLPALGTGSSLGGSKLIAVDTAPPGNVTGFTITPDYYKRNQLIWANPGSDYAQTIIRRGTSPVTCSTGTQIYAGTAQTYIDAGLSSGTLYYYSICVYDGSNPLNVSSGVTDSKAPLVPSATPVASFATISAVNINGVGNEITTNAANLTIAFNYDIVAAGCPGCVSPIFIKISDINGVTVGSAYAAYCGGFGSGFESDIITAPTIPGIYTIIARNAWVFCGDYLPDFGGGTVIATVTIF